MTAVAQTPEVARPAARNRWDVAAACLAAAAFAVLCVLVLRASPYLVEPDDSAYRASIVAMTDGHLFTLSGAQAQALAERLGPGLGDGPVQWVQLPGGRWISEKDPGYPYLAVVFQALGLIRLAPLFYGALACAVIAVLVAWRLRARRLPGSAVAWWLAALFGLGGRAFQDMYRHPFGSQVVVVPGGSGRAVQVGPSGGASAPPSS